MSSILSVLFGFTYIWASWAVDISVSPIAHSDCPLIDDVNHAVMLPYALDCSKYYSCSNGYAYLQQCPNYLQWSTLTYRCDYPDVAKCSQTPSMLTPPQTVVVSPNGLTASLTGEVIYQVHPNDCTRYYKCQALACPTNYHWNSLTQTCDFPHNAHCPFTAGVAVAIDSNINPLLQNLNTLTTANVGDIFAQIYPNDCSKYYQCQAMLCPGNYHWSFRSEQCDLPQLSQCQVQPQLQPQLPAVVVETSSVAVPTAFTAPPTPTVPLAPNVVTENPNLACPECASMCEGYQHLYLPHPYDCHKFIQCNGWSYIHTCPDNLFWNAKLNTCDRICVTI